MVTSGRQRPILRIRRVGVLATCPFPRVQAIVEPATITEVLLEVVYSHDPDLSGEAVVDFLDDVIFGFCDQFFYVFGVHWLWGLDPAENRREQWQDLAGKPQGASLFRHGGEECHFTEVVGTFAYLLGAYPELDLLHGNDSWFALEVEHEELASLLVCELLSLLDGLLLTDVEEPIFVSDDNFFIVLLVI